MGKKLNLAIIYYSATGTNHQMAEWAREAAEDEDVEVRFKKIRETAPDSAIEQNDKWKKHLEATKDIPVAEQDDLDWAHAIIFSSPTRYGNLSSQFKSFIDATGPLWSKGKLVNKVVSAMTSAQNAHGGQESTLLSLYKSMFHWGAIVAAPGYTDEIMFKMGGNPYGVSVSAGGEELNDNSKKAIHHQVKRTIEIAKKLNS
ncbi:NAD(P)H:quinone oxidoreductase type IV [Pontixanthobacter gangjinensis]|uniref:NAD(P)H:quinone oxidoreductase n=1 Tax=Christiangramia aestuarii TaxID=1028746 RepID=A0A7M3SWN5_9FLAO|nr:NAD(P)H:quinone oxidoreductase [Christiangramia aestuarii]MUP41016.1 NAD(P)H:quinone oxidoreductase [Christiangramia aestuarii]